MAKKVTYTFRIKNSFSPVAARIKASTEGIRRKFRLLQLDTAKLSASMTTLGKKMRTVSLMASAGVVGSLKSFGDLEQGVSNVITLLDDDAAVAAFGGKIKGLAKDAVLAGFSIADTNKGLFDTVSALGAGEKAWGAYEASQKLAIAGVTDLSVATDGMTSIMNVYGDSIQNTEDVANAFFTAQKKGKTTVAALAQNIGKVAPIAKTAGVGYKELLATTAQLTLGGLSTEESTTALRQAINALVKPSDGAAKVMKRMGVPLGATELRAAGLGNALSKLAMVAEKHPDLLSEMIPNIRAFTAAASLGEKQLANIDVIVNQIDSDIKTGAGLNDAYTRQMGTFNREMARTWGSIRIMAASIGESIAPMVKVIGSFVRLLASVFDKMSGLWKSVVAMLLTIVAVASPVLLLLGKFGVVAKAIGAAFVAVGGSILFIIAGIGAGILSIIYYWQDLKRELSFGALGDWVKYLFTGDIPEVDVSGSLSQTTRAEVMVGLSGPKGSVESTKVNKTGDTPGMHIGVNNQVPA